jgi:hypothetical protein
MADSKVSALTALTGANVASGDLLYIVDVSATTSGSKAITVAEFFNQPSISMSGLLDAENFHTDTYHSSQYTTSIGENVLALGGTTQRSVYIGTNIAYGSAVNTDPSGPYANIRGCDNVFIGAHNAIGLTTGYRNVGICGYALEKVTTGKANLAVGYRSGTMIDVGYNNMCFGDGALMRATDSYYCSCVGVEAGLSIGHATTRHSITAIGHHAAYGNITSNIAEAFAYTAGNLSTWIGTDCGGDLNTTSTHENTTAIGARAGYLGGANCVFVGYNAGRSCTADNRFYLDALDRSGDANEQSKSLMYGVFATDPANQTLQVNGQLRMSISSRHNDGIRAYFGTDSDSSIYDAGSGVMNIDAGSGRILQLDRETYLMGRTQVRPAAGNAQVDVIGAGSLGSYWKHQTDGEMYFWNTANGNIFVGTNNTLRLTVGYTGNIFTAGNFGVGQSSFGTNAAKVLALANATAPNTSPENAVQVYAEDQASSSVLKIRNESGDIIKLYKETTSVAEAAFSEASGTAVKSGSTFGGYTIGQIVKALQLQGLLT